MSPFAQGFIGVALVSAIPLLGLVTLLVSQKKLDRYMHLLVSFAVGALLGNALLHLLPEIVSESKNLTISALLIIGGIVGFYVLEQFLRWHHAHGDCEDCNTKPEPVAFMNILGDTVHNFLDGLLIAGSFLVNPILGWSTVLAVVLHEIPQEIADFGILLHAKWSIPNIIWVNLISALAAVFGLILGFIANSTFPTFALHSLAFTAGGFIYIACTDLIPDLHNYGASAMRERVIQLCLMLLGIGLFLVL